MADDFEFKCDLYRVPFEDGAVVFDSTDRIRSVARCMTGEKCETRTQLVTDGT